MKTPKTINDFLQFYCDRISELSKVVDESESYYIAELNRLDTEVIKPMMVMYNKLPFDIRRQFLRSKCGNVRAEDMKLYVDYLIKLGA